jgi:hypothetical protein
MRFKRTVETPAGFVSRTPAGSVFPIPPADCVTQPAGSVIVPSPKATPKVPTGGNFGNFLELEDFTGITTEDEVPLVPELGPLVETFLLDLATLGLADTGLEEAFTLLFAWVTTVLATPLDLDAVDTDGNETNSENNTASVVGFSDDMLLLRKRDL